MRNEVARSTDGGGTWTVTAELNIMQGGACIAAQAGRGIFCINAGGSSFRSRSHPIMGVNPTDPTHVYMVYSGGDLDSALTPAAAAPATTATPYSANRPTAAPPGRRRSRSTATRRGKDQYYPWMSVLPNGQIWVGWNDRRDDANNFLSKWYQAHSNDEGATWLDINGAPGNDVVADVQTQPSTFIGDYHGLAPAARATATCWACGSTAATAPPATPTPTRRLHPRPRQPRHLDRLSSPAGEKDRRNKYIASQMEGGNLGQRRRLSRRRCDRDNAE